jgi:acyl dehydratase
LRESPFGGPIAHGFLTLSLIVALLGRTIESRQRAIVNYGFSRVRFIAPVRVRARFHVMNVIDVEGEGVQVVWDVTLEIEGGHKPAGVVEFITRNYF